MLLVYGECGKNSVVVADVYKPMFTLRLPLTLTSLVNFTVEF
jgi:hypothetical protein